MQAILKLLSILLMKILTTEVLMYDKIKDSRSWHLIVSTSEVIC